MGKLSQDHLNRMNPAAHGARLGDVQNDLITNYNLLQASFAALQAKYGLLLAHLDTANVAGIGNGNAAAYGVPATAAAAITPLTGRGNGAQAGGS